MKMIKAEFENIAKHKILTATICAMMIIPFLYSVFFLKSVWDPYGNTGHLPVAVVNKDQSVKFQSSKIPTIPRTSISLSSSSISGIIWGY